MSSRYATIVAFVMATAVVLGVLAYYAGDPYFWGGSFDPMAFFHSLDAVRAGSKGGQKEQEEALDVLIRALEKKERGGGGEMGRLGDAGAGGGGRGSSEVSLQEQFVLRDLRTERQKKQLRAKEHARQAVMRVVEEMSQEEEEEAKQKQQNPAAPLLIRGAKTQKP